MLTTEKMAELEKYLAITNKISDSFDIQQHLWDDNCCCLAPAEPVKLFNMFRRTTMIFYTMLEKKGLLPAMHFSKEQYMAFDAKKYHSKVKVYDDRMFHVCDDAYTSMYKNTMQFYGWELVADYSWDSFTFCSVHDCASLPYQWLSELLMELYGDGSDELDYWVCECDPKEVFADWDYIDELQKKYKKSDLFTSDIIDYDDLIMLSREEQEIVREKLKSIYKTEHLNNLMDCYGNSIFILAYNNPKLDRIHSLMDKLGQQEVTNEFTALDIMSLRTEYGNILKLTKYITDNIALLPVKVDEKIISEKHIYMRAYQYVTNDHTFFDEVEPFMLAQPSMLIALPILDNMMEQFVSKWESSVR